MNLSAAVRAAPAESYPSAFARDADAKLTDREALGFAILFVVGLAILLGLRAVARWLGEGSDEHPGEDQGRRPSSPPAERRRHG